MSILFRTSQFVLLLYLQRKLYIALDSVEYTYYSIIIIAINFFGLLYVSPFSNFLSTKIHQQQELFLLPISKDYCILILLGCIFSITTIYILKAKYEINTNFWVMVIYTLSMPLTNSLISFVSNVKSIKIGTLLSAMNTLLQILILTIYQFNSATDILISFILINILISSIAIPLLQKHINTCEFNKSEVLKFVIPVIISGLFTWMFVSGIRMIFEQQEKDIFANLLYTITIVSLILGGIEALLSTFFNPIMFRSCSENLNQNWFLCFNALAIYLILAILIFKGVSHASPSILLGYDISLNIVGYILIYEFYRILFNTLSIYYMKIGKPAIILIMQLIIAIALLILYSKIERLMIFNYGAMLFAMCIMITMYVARPDTHLKGDKLLLSVLLLVYPLTHIILDIDFLSEFAITLLGASLCYHVFTTKNPYIKFWNID